MRSRSACLGVLVIALASFVSAQDVLSISALHRVAIPDGKVRIRVFLKDVEGTPSGRGGDPIRNLSVEGRFDAGSVLLACGCPMAFVDAGIAGGLRKMASYNLADFSFVRMYAADLPTTPSVRGDLIGYGEGTLVNSVSADSTFSLHFPDALVSGYDIYPVNVDGDPSTEETPANGLLQIVNFNPADADGDGWATNADLSRVQSDVVVALGSTVTKENESSDCDVDGILTPGDVVCTFAEIHGVSAVYPATSPVDVDFDGKADALTDGILVVRRLVGLSGEVLIQNVVSFEGRRVNPVDIAEFVTAMKPMLDIDGDGTADALTDGILLVRYLAGFRGDALVNGATAANAPRSTSQIEEYLGMLTRGYEL